MNFSDMLESAEEHFKEGNYSPAETILNQLILKGCKEASIFHMLGTIYYDQGKFNKAVRAFKRALEINPGFTDASVGLSIILNDLGRYEEGQKVFEEAKAMLSTQQKLSDPFINSKLAIKHDELGELYFQYARFDSALEQFYKAHNLEQKPETLMKVVECYLELDNEPKATKELQSIISDFPSFHPARIKLGKIYFDQKQFQQAREEWQNILVKDSENEEARQLIEQIDSQPIEYEDNDSPLSEELR